MRPINTIHIYGLLPLLEPERHMAVGRRMKKFAKCEWLSRGELRQQQWDALRRLLLHAQKSTAFYRRRFQSVGFDARSDFGPADLSNIPPLTRDDIRKHLAEMCSLSYRSEELKISATGGTTDTPVKFYRDKESVREKTALQLQLNTWAGMYPGDRVFYLWGAQSDYPANPSWRWRLYDEHLMGHHWAPSSVLDAEIAEHYRVKANAFKPRVIYAYPTPLAILCDHLRQSGRPFHRPVAAICTAESLAEVQRLLIEETLGCPVFVQYGSREFGMIASECRFHAGLHLATPAAYVEYLPVTDAEEDGLHEIVVTDLLNYGMPLIRYRVNDCVILGNEQCECGRGYPLVKSIIGRTSDVLSMPDGTTVPGIALTNRVLQVCPELKKIQIIQETRENLRIRFVRGESFGPDALKTLEANLRLFFPKQVHWTFEEVQDIERERSGKTRFCISKVPPIRASTVVSSLQGHL